MALSSTWSGSSTFRDEVALGEELQHVESQLLIQHEHFELNLDFFLHVSIYNATLYYLNINWII